MAATAPFDPEDHASEDHVIVEGIARVVAVEGAVAVLEPEQTTACGSCQASGACGVKPGSARLAARRFTLANNHHFQVGERVVVGIPEQSVRRAALTAYGIPLLVMLVSGVTVQKLGGGDLGAALATLGGLAVGIGIVHLQSTRLAKRGDYTPHYLRRATDIGGACELDR